MSSSTPIIDIHSHSTLKPYGNSFYKNANIRDIYDSACIWKKDPFTEVDKGFENTIGVSRYRQSDFSTLVEGQVKIVLTSLYPQEIGFFESRQNLPNSLETIIAQFASLIGKRRIEYIKGRLESKYNYFEDLENEYKFLMALNEISPQGSAMKYRVVSSKNELYHEPSLLVIPTIEGAHVFCNGTDVKNIANWDGLDHRVSKVKAWNAPPLFITLAHHFYNGICTHAQSLMGITGKLLDQTEGMRDYNYQHYDSIAPISDIGFKLIKLLLSNDNGRRILIDVKHMSIDARKAYYKYLSENHPNNDVPVLCSHGALTDLYPHQINMEKKLDILQIYKTKGLFGIELDQRVLGYNEANKIWQKLKNLFRSKRKKEQHQLFFLWQNIIQTAEFAYQNGYTENPWSCICIGSDYDGIINPLNEFRDAKSLSKLYVILTEFLEEYWENKNSIIPKESGIERNAQDIVYEIMYKNAYNFITKHYG